MYQGAHGTRLAAETVDVASTVGVAALEGLEAGVGATAGLGVSMIGGAGSTGSSAEATRDMQTTARESEIRIIEVLQAELRAG